MCGSSVLCTICLNVPCGAGTNQCTIAGSFSFYFYAGKSYCKKVGFLIFGFLSRRICMEQIPVPFFAYRAMHAVFRGFLISIRGCDLQPVLYGFFYSVTVGILACSRGFVFLLERRVPRTRRKQAHSRPVTRLYTRGSMVSRVVLTNILRVVVSYFSPLRASSTTRRTTSLVVRPSALASSWSQSNWGVLNVMDCLAMWRNIAPLNAVVK